MILFKSYIALCTICIAVIISNQHMAMGRLQSLKDSRVTQCGGSIESDGDSLTYPKPGDSVSSGDLCVWTIHLETLKVFKFNFSALDIPSSNADCSHGAVRIYSLTNLIPTDNLETYIFCNEKPSSGDFYVSENVVTVVFYVDHNNPQALGRFTLNWQGIAYDSSRTSHISSFSNSPNGIIRYPVDGEYDPNISSTWLVQNGNIVLDIDFRYISLEECGNKEDPCVCDAIILYEITTLGVLEESERFCGERPNFKIQGAYPNFIVGFFSDGLTVGGFGTGFEVIYKPSVEEFTTTAGPTPTTTGQSSTPIRTEYTTTIPTTAPTSQPSTSTTDIPNGNDCGEVLVGESGTIQFKYGQTYDNGSRCIWIVRAPRSTNISFQLVDDEFEPINDFVTVLGFSYDRPFPFTDSVNFMRGNRSPKSVKGTVAMVVFSSDLTVSGTGFIMTFTGNEYYDEPFLSSSSLDYISDKTTEAGFSYPYANNELSVFAIAPPNFILNNGASINNNLHITGIQSCAFCGCDSLAFYRFSPQAGLHHSEKFCGVDISTNFTHEDIIVYAFVSDSSIIQKGFDLNWKWV